MGGILPTSVPAEAVATTLSSRLQPRSSRVTTRTLLLSTSTGTATTANYLHNGFNRLSTLRQHADYSEANKLSQ